MFSDTGKLSFWLSIFFVATSICGIIAIYLIAKRKILEAENLDKIIDLGKWFFVSVAITLSTSIINDGFREREQDIKEMEIFDKYTGVVMELDGAVKRKLLAEYFSSVSPDGPIKRSWGEYKKIVDSSVAKINEAAEKSIVIAKKEQQGTATKSEIEERFRLQEMTATLNQSILPSGQQSGPKPRIYFHIRDESQRTEAKKIADQVEATVHVDVPGIQRLDAGPSSTELRYFRSAEAQEANEISVAISSMGLKVITKYIPGFESSTNIRPRHYELWISSVDLPKN